VIPVAFLQLQSVALTYSTEKSGRPALTDVSLEINEGEFVAIIGPSGCGKSSTISLLAGLVLPNKGTVMLAGQHIQGPGPDRAVVFQDYSLFPWMTSLSNILFALKQVGRPLKEEALCFLEMVGLADAAHKYPGELSGGMRQRVAIARAFALDAPVYLMDEPFGAVDAKNRIMLQDLLLRLWGNSSKKRTILLVTHDIDEALYLADRIVVFTPGPGRVRRVLDVPFSRPRRRINIVHDPVYVGLRNDILSLLQDELLEELEQVEGGAGI
jgi:NitT/TauT family transport system ATP-binding protein